MKKYLLTLILIAAGTFLSTSALAAKKTAAPTKPTLVEFAPPQVPYQPVTPETFEAQTPSSQAESKEEKKQRKALAKQEKKEAKAAKKAAKKQAKSGEIETIIAPLETDTAEKSDPVQTEDDHSEIEAVGKIPDEVEEEAPLDNSKKGKKLREKIAKKLHIKRGSEPQVRVLMGGRGKNRIQSYPMETYLAGVIGNEMSARRPVEALKSQTVAARSYALYGIQKARASGRNFDVHPTQADQVFRIRESQNPYLLQVVSQTRGEILTNKGKIVQAFYSSTCGGTTRSARQAGLSDDSPLVKGCSDNYCEISPFKGWYVEQNYSGLEKLFAQKGVKLNGLKSVKVKSHDAYGYAIIVALEDKNGTHHIKAEKFRNVLGYMRLKSVSFKVVNTDNGIHIHGAGFGHGVGLCQYGAKAMALKNKNYKMILKKFYPGTTLQQIY